MVVRSAGAASVQQQSCEGKQLVPTTQHPHRMCLERVTLD